MATDIDAMRAHIGQGIPTVLPEHPGISEDVDHAPARRQILSSKEKKLALRNALRYFPENLHGELANEFVEEFGNHMT